MLTHYTLPAGGANFQIRVSRQAVERKYQSTSFLLRRMEPANRFREWCGQPAAGSQQSLCADEPEGSKADDRLVTGLALC